MKPKILLLLFVNEGFIYLTFCLISTYNRDFHKNKRKNLHYARYTAVLTAPTILINRRDLNWKNSISVGIKKKIIFWLKRKEATLLLLFFSCTQDGILGIHLFAESLSYLLCVGSGQKHSLVESNSIGPSLQCYLFQ